MNINPILKSKCAHWAARLKLFLLPCERNGYRARIFSGSFLTLFFISMLVLKLGFFSFMASFPKLPFYADITKMTLVDMANENRSQFDVPALAESPELEAAAYMKARDMEKNGYFAHTSPSGITPWHWFNAAGYDYRYAGENLAIGFIDSKEVQEAWRASPTHEANIVNSKYQEIGVAVYRANFNGNPATIVVQLFGTRRGDIPGVNGGAAANTNTNNTNTIAESAAAKDVLGASTSRDGGVSFPQRAAMFFSNGYFIAVQWLIYGAMSLVILLLFVNFALSADFGRPEILAKAIGFVVLMMVFGLIDRSLVIALIPHHVSIF